MKDNKIKILAIDPALKSTGAVILEYNVLTGETSLIEYFNSVVRQRKPVKGTRRVSSSVRTMQIFAKRIEDLLIDPADIDLLVIEKAVNFGRRRGLVDRFEFIGMLKWHFRSRLSQIVEVYPATLKKWATGNGRATKKDMLKACKDRFDVIWTEKQHDICDAYLLARYALDKFIHNELTISKRIYNFLNHLRPVMSFPHSSLIELEDGKLELTVFTDKKSDRVQVTDIDFQIEPVINQIMNDEQISISFINILLKSYRIKYRDTELIRTRGSIVMLFYLIQKLLKKTELENRIVLRYKDRVSDLRFSIFTDEGSSNIIINFIRGSLQYTIEDVGGFALISIMPKETPRSSIELCVTYTTKLTYLQNLETIIQVLTLNQLDILFDWHLASGIGVNKLTETEFRDFFRTNPTDIQDETRRQLQ